MSSDRDTEPDSHREARATARKHRDALQDLLRSPGWSILATFIEAQKQARLGKLLTEPTLDDREVTFTRGEMHAFELILTRPKAALATALEEIDLLKDTRDGDPGDDND